MTTHRLQGRHNLKIKSKYTVLEIAAGSHPSYRSDILTEKYTAGSNLPHGEIRIFPHQVFIEAETERLPFNDNSFDYVICNKMLEHTDHPDRIIREISRVGRHGYIETTSMLGEFISPDKGHKWMILIIDGKLVFYDKNQLPLYYSEKYEELFLTYLPYHRNIQQSEISVILNSYFTINCLEWTGQIDCIINPDDEYYKTFFQKKWDKAMSIYLYPKQNITSRIWHSACTLYYIVKEKLLLRVRPQTMSLKEYKEKQMDI